MEVHPLALLEDRHFSVAVVRVNQAERVIPEGLMAAARVAYLHLMLVRLVHPAS